MPTECSGGGAATNQKELPAAVKTARGPRVVARRRHCERRRPSELRPGGSFADRELERRFPSRAERRAGAAEVDAARCSSDRWQISRVRRRFAQPPRASLRLGGRTKAESSPRRRNVGPHRRDVRESRIKQAHGKLPSAGRSPARAQPSKARATGFARRDGLIACLVSLRALRDRLVARHRGRVTARM